MVINLAWCLKVIPNASFTVSLGTLKFWVVIKPKPWERLRKKRLSPNKRPPSLFVIANYKKFKGKSEVFGEIDAKWHKKVGLFQF